LRQHATIIALSLSSFKTSFLKILIKIIYLISVMIFSLTLKSQTIVTGGYVSGIWDPSSSPYLVQGNLLVHADSTLEISAGTTVLFTYTYRLEVQGQLLVTGTPTQPVILDRDPGGPGWQGIFFNTTDTSITDSSILVNGYIRHSYPAPGITISSSSRLRISDFTIDSCEAFRGAGINCISSDPYFSGLNVHSNTALDGAGIALENSSAVLKNCTITQNTADGAGGGMVIFSPGNAVLENCTISQNQSHGSGGGVYINNSSPVFLRCQFLENEGAKGGSTLYSGGGVSVKLGANPDFINCTFSNNISHREGGGIATFSVTRLINCLFSANTAETWGGGVFLSSGNLITSPVTNCTFSDNEGMEGTAVAMHNHKAVIRNSILWTENPLNPGSMVFLDSQFSWNLLDISYTDIQNGQAGIKDSGTTQYTWGAGNINSNPVFLPGSAELSWQSPCIEAGTPDTNLLQLPELDLAGNPRLANDRIDIGAYEYQLALQIPNSKFQIPNHLTIFPNPAREWVWVEVFEHQEVCIIELISSSGLVLMQVDLQPGEKSVKIDLRSFAAGVYLVRVPGKGIDLSQKIIIRR
jgi:parallel beta-helix repeat protein